MNYNIKTRPRRSRYQSMRLATEWCLFFAVNIVLCMTTAYLHKSGKLAQIVEVVTK